LADKIESGGTVSQLTKEALLGRKDQAEQNKTSKGRSEDDDRLKAAMGKRGGGSG